MKAYKYEIADFALYDYAYVQRHLEEMAAKGWYLEKVGTSGLWRYRAGTPAKVRYEVTYAPTGNVFNPGPTEQEHALAEFCAQAGWRKVASIGTLHIYFNRDPEAVPIETDEEIRLETLRKAMKGQYVLSRVILLVALVIQWATQLANLEQNPIRTLSMGSMVLTLTALPGCILLNAVDLLGYFHWLWKAGRAVRAGLPCPEGKFCRRMRIVTLLFLAVFLGMLAWVEEVWGMLWIIAIMLVTIAVCSLVMEIMKGLGAGAVWNVAVTFLAVLVVMGLMLILGADVMGQMRQTEAAEDLPLMAEQFLEDGEPASSNLVLEETDSILSGYGCYWNDKYGEPGYKLQYTIVDIHADFLEEPYRSCMLEEYLENMDAAYDAPAEQIDPIGSAETIWRCGEEGRESLLLFFDGRIVRVYIDRVLTEGELARMVELLG